MSDFLGTIESLADRYAEGTLQPSQVVAAHIDQIKKRRQSLVRFSMSSLRRPWNMPSQQTRRWLLAAGWGPFMAFHLR